MTKKDPLDSVEVYPGDGWPLLAMARELSPIPVDVARNLSVPQTFHTMITPKGSDAWSLALLFRVVDGEVLFVGATSEGDELHTALKRAFEIRPLRWWQTGAFKSVLGHQIESDEESVYFASLDSGGNEDAALEVLGAFRALRGATPPVGRRRNRITGKLLEEVAEVYRRAFEDGDAPTRAVGVHFEIPYSTAANWVARARKEGPLGPAQGTKGGEVAR